MSGFNQQEREQNKHKFTHIHSLSRYPHTNTYTYILPSLVHLLFNSRYELRHAKSLLKSETRFSKAFDLLHFALLPLLLLLVHIDSGSRAIWALNSKSNTKYRHVLYDSRRLFAAVFERPRLNRKVSVELLCVFVGFRFRCQKAVELMTKQFANPIDKFFKLNMAPPRTTPALLSFFSSSRIDCRVL